MDFEGYLSHLDQPVAILDRLHQVVSMNAAFSALFPLVERGESLRAFTGDYPALLPLLEKGEGSYEMAHGGRHYSAAISYVRRGRQNKPVARCVLVTDVSETVRLLREVERRSALLQESNEQLHAQNSALEESIRLERQAATLRVQAQLLRDIHDTLGHTLVMLGALYGQALDALPDEHLAGMRLREALKWTGLSIAELEAAGDYSTGSFVAFLHRFRGSMAQAGLQVTLWITGDELPEHGYMYADLVRICQEAATNAIKHGRATALYVTYRLGPDSVAQRIEDNGRTPPGGGQGPGLGGHG